MEKTVKEAADSLLSKGSITQAEYDSIDIEKVGAMSLKKLLGAIGEEISEKAPEAIFKTVTNPTGGKVGSKVMGDLATKGVTSVAERAMHTLENKPLMDALKKNPKFAKEYMKLVSGDIKSDAFQDAMKNPALIQQLNKNLTDKSFLDNVGKMIRDKWWMAPATIGAAVVGKEGIVDPIIQESRINKSFTELPKYTPQLAEADQDKIRDYFNVVKTYSPHSAANPLVAGALVNKMMEFGGVDHKLIQDLSNIQSNRTNLESVKTMVGGGVGAFSKIPSE